MAGGSFEVVKFDTAYFQGQRGHHTKTSLYLLLLLLGLQNMITAHRKSWPANHLAVKNFGHIFLKTKWPP